MTKNSTSFYLSSEAKIQLKMIADLDKRSQANMLEIVIEEEFKKRGLKMPIEKPAAPKSPKKK